MKLADRSGISTNNAIGGFIAVIFVVLGAAEFGFIPGVYIPGSPFAKPPIDASWVRQFIVAVNVARHAEFGYWRNLTESQALDQFAQVRFNTMTSGTNWQISHYGYYSDSIAFNSSILRTEEVLYPEGSTPNTFGQQLKTIAPVHYDELMNGLYNHYGFHIGSGLWYELGKGSSTLTCTELVGVGNATQELEQAGCSFSIKSMPWLVLELSE